MVKGRRKPPGKEKDMARTRYHNVRVTYMDSKGEITVSRYSDTIEEFPKSFTKRMIEKKGFTIVKVEKIHEPIEYIR